MDKKLFKYELSGALIIAMAGSMLHFTFDWSNHFYPLALISPVNESVWEHLKIAFWPALFYSLAEYILFGKEYKNFFIGKALCLMTIPFVIMAVFYGYTAFTGHSILAVDISTFVVSIFAGQLTGYKVITSRYFVRWTNYTSIALLVLFILAFSVFTYYPPHNPVFKETRSGEYGIIPK